MAKTSQNHELGNHTQCNRKSTSNTIRTWISRLYRQLPPRVLKHVRPYGPFRVQSHSQSPQVENCTTRHNCTVHTRTYMGGAVPLDRSGCPVPVYIHPCISNDRVPRVYLACLGPAGPTPPNYHSVAYVHPARALCSVAASRAIAKYVSASRPRTHLEARHVVY